MGWGMSGFIARLKINTDKFGGLAAEEQDGSGQQTPPNPAPHPHPCKTRQPWRCLIPAATRVFKGRFEPGESFHKLIHPKNKRRKKKRLVGRSIQKNAQPRLTMTKVSAQAASLAKRVECRVSRDVPD